MDSLKKTETESFLNTFFDKNNKIPSINLLLYEAVVQLLSKLPDPPNPLAWSALDIFCRAPYPQSQILVFSKNQTIGQFFHRVAMSGGLSLCFFLAKKAPWVPPTSTAMSMAQYILYQIVYIK